MFRPCSLLGRSLPTPPSFVTKVTSTNPAIDSFIASNRNNKVKNARTLFQFGRNDINTKSNHKTCESFTISPVKKQFCRSFPTKFFSASSSTEFLVCPTLNAQRRWNSTGIADDDSTASNTTAGGLKLSPRLVNFVVSRVHASVPLRDIFIKYHEGMNIPLGEPTKVADYFKNVKAELAKLENGQPVAEGVLDGFSRLARKLWTRFEVKSRYIIDEYEKMLNAASRNDNAQLLFLSICLIASLQAREEMAADLLFVVFFQVAVIQETFSLLWPAELEAKTLIASTIAEMEKIKLEASNRRAPICQKIVDRHTAVVNQHRGSAEQWKFLESNKVFSTCSNNARDACCSRFVNPHCPSGTRDVLVSVSLDDAVASFDSAKVNIVAGPSGSGKTLSSLLNTGNGKSATEVFNILVHAGFDGCKCDVSGEDDNLQRNREALRHLLVGIVRSFFDKKHLENNTCAANGKPVAANENLKKFWERAIPRDDNELEKMWKDFDELLGMKSHSIHEKTNFFLRIVLDEIGGRPLLVQALSQIWGGIRERLATSFGVKPEVLQLAVVGTGSECFQMYPPGPLPNAYAVFVVDKKKLSFKVIFTEYLSGNYDRFGQKLFEMMFDEMAPNYGLCLMSNDPLANTAATSNDPVVRSLQRLSTNVRCAALLMELIFDHANKSTRLNNIAWSVPQVRAVIAGWTRSIADSFTSKNGLSKFCKHPEYLAAVLGRAISFALNRDRQFGDVPISFASADISSTQYVDYVTNDKEFLLRCIRVWWNFGAKYGLLFDTAKLIDAKTYDPKLHDIVYCTYSDATKTTISGFYVARKGEPRFTIQDAFVMMYLHISHASHDVVLSRTYGSIDLVFEEAVLDFARIAAQLGKKTPADKIVPDDDGFTAPHLLYGLGVPVVYTSTLTFKMDEKALMDQQDSKFFNHLIASADFWRQKIHDENAAFVLLNGDRAQGSDLIILSRNRIVFVQCKNQGTNNLSEEKMNSALNNLVQKPLMMEVLSWCVCYDDYFTNNNNNNVGKIEVLYTIAARRKDSFCKSSTDNEGTNKKNKYFWKKGAEPLPISRVRAVRWNATATMKIDRFKLLENHPFPSYELSQSIHFTYTETSASRKSTSSSSATVENFPPFYPILQSPVLPVSPQAEIHREMIYTKVWKAQDGSVEMVELIKTHK